MVKDYSQMEQYLSAELDRPFGGLQMRSNLEFFGSNHAVEEAADNLLLKARRDLVDQNPVRAEAYIEKALRLPVNQLTESPAAQSSAHMMLFMMICDEVESAVEEDASWLDRALSVASTCGPLARLDLLGVLKSVASDYRLEAAESDRIRAVVAGDPEAALELLIANGDVSVKDVVHQCIDAVIQYEKLT
jgi:hypothetical protein